LAEPRVSLKQFARPVGCEWTGAKCLAMKSSPPPRRRDGRVLPPEEYKKQRRMERTSRFEEQVRIWTQGHGCSLRVLNDGHHWLFQKPGSVTEWWPSSARLAVNRDYGSDIHAPHWADVVTVLEQRLAAALPRGPGVSLVANQAATGGRACGEKPMNNGQLPAPWPIPADWAAIAPEPHRILAGSSP
jgi:hypothetical protein